MDSTGGSEFVSPDAVAVFCEAHFQLQVVEVIPLEGGLSNYVHRVLCANDKSAIFKHYPPFVRAHESVPYSQSRYFVEKEVLHLASGIGVEGVRTPRVLGSVDSKFVLLMEDAGSDLLSLKDYLQRSSAQIMGNVIQMADKLADFLLSLYATPLDKPSPVFDNPAAWEVLNRFLYKGFAERAERSGIPEVIAYSREVTSTCPPPDPVIIMGDLWPNSIHIDMGTNTIWILDWEMARLGHPFSDTRQMVTNLWVMEQLPGQFRHEEVRAFKTRLMQRMGHLKGQSDSEVLTHEVSFMALVTTLINNPFWHFPDGQAATMLAFKDRSKVFDLDVSSSLAR